MRLRELLAERSILWLAVFLLIPASGSLGAPLGFASTLTRPPDTTAEAFGYALAVQPDRILVGVPSFESPCGAAALYATSGALLKILQAPGGQCSGNAPTFDAFGAHVAGSGALFAVSAVGQGRVYTYDAEGTPIATLGPPPSSQASPFGRSIAVDDDGLVAVGGALEGVYVFDGRSGVVLSLVPASSLGFGAAVALAGGRVFVGEPDADRILAFDAGTGTFIWSQTLQYAKDVPSLGLTRFGAVLVAHDGRLFVSGHRRESRSLVYQLDAATGDVGRTYRGPFGLVDSMAAADGQLVVGLSNANEAQGIARVYSVGSGRRTASLRLPRDQREGARAGRAVAILDGRIFVGAPGVPTVASFERRRRRPR